MKVSRKASIPAAVAVTLGLVATGVSCTGSKTEKTEAPGKTSGPAIAKSDKTVAKPGSTPGTAAGSAVAAIDTEAPLPPPKPGAPLPPPVAAPSLPGTPKPPAVAPTVTAPTPPKPPVAPTVTAPTPPKPPVAPTVTAPTPPKPPVAPTVTAPTPPKPATAPQPPVAPAVAAPSKPAPAAAVVAAPAKPVSEADRLLQQRIQELQLEREKRQIMTAAYLDNAREAARNSEWQEVAEWSSKALEVDHGNADAEHLLRQARAAQGMRDASIASLNELMVQSKRIKQDQARFTVQSHYDAAMKAKAAGEYTRAASHLDLADAAMSIDPSGVEWGDLRARIRKETAEVARLKTDADEAAKRKAATDAYRAIKAEEAKARLADAEKRQALFRSAMDLFEAEDFEKAAARLEEYLRDNPSDRNAKSLHMTAVRAQHHQASEETLRDQREQFAKWRIDMQETTIPYHRILTWPSQEHWNTITEKRRDLGTISEPVQDSPETAATRARLRNDRVSFSFSGSPFKDVVNFIATAKGMNIYIESQIAGELDSVQIGLTLNDVTVEHALNMLCKVAGGLTYVVQGSVVYVTKPELARADPIIQVHAVGDLTVSLTNFIAGNLQLLPANAEENEENPRFDQPKEGQPAFGGITELIELVKKNTASEEYWGTEGVNIAESGTDKMLVVAEPSVQRAVSKFLEDLREFSGLVVTIETRFLTVTDNFLRDVGVDIRGLGNGSPGPLAVLDDITNGLDDNASAGFDNNGSGLPANASGRPSAGAFFNNNSDGDYRAHVEGVFDRALGSKITNAGGFAVQWSLVDDTNISMILRAVEKSQEGRLLQAPNITVYNTQRANITLINQLTYIQDFDVEVAQTAFIADPIIGIIQDGLVLDVQPTVSHDRKYVTLTLRPTIANLVRPIPTFTTSLGAFTTPVTIQIPELKVEKAGTTVRVPDGGTLLMGGLKTINMADLKAETPWFSSIPFASFFFGRKGTVKEMDHLMVIVKATISDLKEQERMLRR